LQWEVELQDRLETTEPAFVDGDDRVLSSSAKRTWRKPEITSFLPATEAEALGVTSPGDGGNNVC
jgi:hypothetical protein